VSEEKYFKFRKLEAKKRLKMNNKKMKNLRKINAAA
jgi:hypothetical protein